MGMKNECRVWIGDKADGLGMDVGFVVNFVSRAGSLVQVGSFPTGFFAGEIYRPIYR